MIRTLSGLLEPAKKSKIFDKIVLNSDSDLFRPISKRYNIDFYLRPKRMGNSQIKSDDVVNDFIEKYPNFDIAVWVNPIAPLQDEHDLKKIVRYFLKKKLDSLITTEKKQVHTHKLGIYLWIWSLLFIFSLL